MKKIIEALNLINKKNYYEFQIKATVAIEVEMNDDSCRTL